MSKQVLTLDLLTGQKKLETIIDDIVAKGNDKATYSGSYIDTHILSVAHEEHQIGNKVLDDSVIGDKYVIAYDLADDKLQYQNVDNLFNEIDCGYF